MSTKQKNIIKPTDSKKTKLEPPKQPKTSSTDPTNQQKAEPSPDEIKETIQDNYLYTKLSYILFFINLTLLIFSIINIVELAECEKNPSKNCPRPYALEKGAKSQDNVNGCYTLLQDQGGKKKRL